MSVFAGIENVEVFGGSQNMRAGDHVVKINQIITHQSRAKSGVVYMIAEVEVIESIGGRATTAKEVGDPILSIPHAAGETLSWLVDLTQDMGKSNARGFGLAVAKAMAKRDGLDPSPIRIKAITIPVMEELVSPEQPARGVTLRADAFMILTRAGNDFTRVIWRAA